MVTKSRTQRAASQTNVVPTSSEVHAPRPTRSRQVASVLTLPPHPQLEQKHQRREHLEETIRGFKINIEQLSASFRNVFFSAKVW
ncbi:hypothetical protein L484_021449 [Morus notabilis]|uniref:Uncharacterized protein n=1 Tax=Morus notabilis TaxID=981085 RepID=W9RPE2_9ROSA|nr:hypothetical protein L484_021449 [Morus notabilis]